MTFYPGGVMRTGRRRGTLASDIRSLVAVLGGDAAVIGFYDARFGITITGTGVSSWADARGSSGFGPTLVQGTDAARPAYSASERTVSFDGSDDFLRATDSAYAAVTAACALVWVGTIPSTGGVTTECIADLSDASDVQILTHRRAVNDGVFRVEAAAANAATRTAAAGTRVHHGRRTASSAGTVTCGARIGSAVEGTTTPTVDDLIGDRLTLGGSRADTPSSFGDPIIRALLVIAGDYTSAMQTAVNEWGKSFHGATL